MYTFFHFTHIFNYKLSLNEYQMTEKKNVVVKYNGLKLQFQCFLRKILNFLNLLNKFENHKYNKKKIR